MNQLKKLSSNSNHPIFNVERLSMKSLFKYKFNLCIFNESFIKNLKSLEFGGKYIADDLESFAWSENFELVNLETFEARCTLK